jgi:hypothetical protein
VKKNALRIIAGQMPRRYLNFEKTNHRHTYSSIKELPRDIAEAKIKNLAGVVMPSSSMDAFASGSMSDPLKSQYVTKIMIATGIDQRRPAIIPLLFVGDQLIPPLSTQSSHATGNSKIQIFATAQMTFPY